MKTFIYADPHFGHENIIKYTGRPFKDVEEMNITLIKNYNEVVSDDDEVYFLGDVALYDAAKFVAQLKGKKILILGNHDRRRKITYWKKAGFKEVYKKPFRLNNKYILSHEPLTDLEDFINIHGHIHEKEMGEDSYICACVEHTDYKPILLEELINK